MPVSGSTGLKGAGFRSPGGGSITCSCIAFAIVFDNSISCQVLYGSSLKNATMQKLTDREIKRLWILRNPGILTKIANSLEPPVTRSAVQGVFVYGLKSSGRRIELALVKAGAPLMKERLAEPQTDGEYKAMQRRLKRA